MWLITHPVIEICIQTYHSKRTRTSKTKAILLSPLIYISYGYLFLKGNKYIKEPIVFNLCQLYSILIIAPVLFKRAFYFGLLQNEEIKLQTKNKWYIGILDVCLFVWFISYLIQEISQSFSESSVFVANGFNVFAKISKKINVTSVKFVKDGQSFPKKGRIKQIIGNDISRDNSLIDLRKSNYRSNLHPFKCSQNSGKDADINSLASTRNSVASKRMNLASIPLTVSAKHYAKKFKSKTTKNGNRPKFKFLSRSRSIDVSSGESYKKKYFRNYWNQIDILLLIFMLIYFIGIICKKIDLTMICFYIFTVVIIFRLFEYVTFVIPRISPFIQAFISIWKDIVLFLFVVALLALANSVGLSAFLCVWEPSTLQKSKDQANDTKFSYTDSFESWSQESRNYSDCLISVFWYLFLTPLGTGTTLLEMMDFTNVSSQNGREILTNLKKFSAPVQHTVLVIVTIYYISTAFCLLRGVIVKFVVINRQQSLALLRYQKIKHDLQMVFSEIDENYPIPWNLVIFLCKVGKRISELVWNFANKIFMNRQNNLRDQEIVTKV